MNLFADCTSLEEAVFTAIGAASTAWHEDGVFDESFSTQIAMDLLDTIDRFTSGE